MRDIFVATVVFGLLPKAFTRPDIGLMLFCWLSYMNPHRLCYGFAVNFPFAQAVAMATLSGLMVWKEPKKIPWTPTTILLLAFLVWMFITTCFAFNQQFAWHEFNQVWKIQLMTFLIVIIMTTKERINNLLWVMALSLGFYGFKGGLFTITSGGGARVWGPSGTFIGGNNEIGLALLMTIPILRYLQLTSTNFIIKQGMTAGIILSLFCVLGTQSRGALVGMSAMLLFLVLKSRNKLPLLLVLGITVPMAISFMPESWHSRMNTIKTYEKDGSAMGRINAWKTAVNIAVHRPLGCGYKCLHTDLAYDLYSPNPNDMHDAHSIYFEVIAEHGWIGLGLFMGIGYTAWRTSSKTIKLAKKNPDTKWAADLCSMLQVSLMGYASAGAFLGLAMFDLFYNVAAIIVACNVIITKSLAAPVTAPSLSPTSPQPKRPGSFVKPPIRTAGGSPQGATDHFSA